MQLFATAVLVDLGRVPGGHAADWIESDSPDIELVLTVDLGALHPTRVQTAIGAQVGGGRLHNHVVAADGKLVALSAATPVEPAFDLAAQLQATHRVTPGDDAADPAHQKSVLIQPFHCRLALVPRCGLVQGQFPSLRDARAVVDATVDTAAVPILLIAFPDHHDRAISRDPHCGFALVPAGLLVDDLDAARAPTLAIQCLHRDPLGARRTAVLPRNQAAHRP